MRIVETGEKSCCTLHDCVNQRLVRVFSLQFDTKLAQNT
jgi:hypothetical protein